MKTGNGSVSHLDPRMNAMMAAAQEQAHQQQTMGIVGVCTAIVTNRDKLCGPMASAKSVEIVDRADALLLDWFKGLSASKDEAE